MNDTDESGKKIVTRREFVRTVGKSIFMLTALAQVGPAFAQAPCYCEGEPECDAPGEHDGTCGWLGDADGGCGEGEEDNHCGSSSDTDDNCEPPCSDAYDSDGSCNMGGDETDDSCGDCDDNHDTDSNCSVNNDPDDLCGHPHYVGGEEDDNCSATGNADSFCGTYNFDYQFGSWTDTDQHCGVNGDTDNSNDDRTAGCTNDTNSPEWHFSG